MNSSEAVSYVSIAVIAVSLFFIGTSLTGFALIDTGEVNVTITSTASIVFSTATLDFGTGAISTSGLAWINSEGANNSYWIGDQAPTTGLILENDGNVNVSFDLNATKTPADFLGGATPGIEVKVTDEDTGSCTDFGGSAFNPSYADIGTGAGQNACENFGFETGDDKVAIDVNLSMNSDANSGENTITITATATAV